VTCAKLMCKSLNRRRGQLTCCIVLQLGTGLVRAIITSKDHSTLDIIPVDMTANAVIAAGWYTAVTQLVTRVVSYSDFT